MTSNLQLCVESLRNSVEALFAEDGIDRTVARRKSGGTYGVPPEFFAACIAAAEALAPELAKWREDTTDLRRLLYIPETTRFRYVYHP